MSDRETKVSLRLQYQQYVDGMNAAAKATAKTNTEAQKLAEARKHFDLLSKTAVAGSVAIGVGLAAVVAKAAQFDQAISGIQAATHASAKEMTAYRDAALEAGAKTVYSATESADAITELAKAGLSTSAILGGGLTGALNLAAAGGLGVADAAGVAATTLQQFGLKGNQASHVADLLAAGAGKAMGDVSDLSQALNQSGTVAAQFGLSVDDTVGALSAFASAGLLGSDAGTSFRTMLLALAKPSGQAADTMKQLGINAYDAGGQFVGVAGLAGQLQKALGGLTQEQRNATLATIFGQDAIRAANVLYVEGAKGIENWTNKVDDQGYAAKTAAIQLDNLKGDVEQLQGSLETAFISMGEGAQGPLRDLTKGLTGLVNGFNDLPGPVKESVTAVAGLTAVVLAAGGAYGLLIPKIAAYNAAIAAGGPGMARADAVFRSLGRTLGKATIAGTVIGASFQLSEMWRDKLQPTAEDLANALKTSNTAMELFQKTTVATASTLGGIQIKPIVKDAEELHKVLKRGDQEASGFWGWLGANTKFDGDGSFGVFREGWQKLTDQMVKTPSTIAPTFMKLRDEYSLSTHEISRLIQMSDPLKAALTDQATAAGMTASKTNLVKLALGEADEKSRKTAEALKSLSGVAVNASDSVSDLADQIRNFGKAQFDVEDANRAFEQAIDDATAAVKANGRTLDIHTQQGRDNAEAAERVAAATLEVVASQAAQGASEDVLQQKMAAGRQAFIDARIAMGDSKQAAEQYADKLGLIPSNVTTIIAANTTPAEQAIAAFLQRVKGQVATINVRAKLPDLNGAVSGSGRFGTFASGGQVAGPGSGTSDSVLARLSNGEHVWTAAEVAAAGGQGAMYAMRAAVRQGGTFRYGSGGSVGATSAPQSVSRGLTIENINANGIDAQEVAQRIETQWRRSMAAAGIGMADIG